MLTKRLSKEGWLIFSASFHGVDIEMYGDAKYKWLKKFLELPYGIPSHDTFARVFARLDPKQFQECFLSWVKSISKITDNEIVAIDGKSLRHSYDDGGEKAAIHMVSAWATSQKAESAQVYRVYCHNSDNY